MKKKNEILSPNLIKKLGGSLCLLCETLCNNFFLLHRVEKEETQRTTEKKNVFRNCKSSNEIA